MESLPLYAHPGAKSIVNFGKCLAPGVQYSGLVALATVNDQQDALTPSICNNTIQVPASFVPIIRSDALSLRWRALGTAFREALYEAVGCSYPTLLRLPVKTQGSADCTCSRC